MATQEGVEYGLNFDLAWNFLCIFKFIQLKPLMNLLRDIIFKIMKAENLRWFFYVFLTFSLQNFFLMSKFHPNLVRGPASRIPTVNEKFWFCRYDDSYLPRKFFGIPKIFILSKNFFEMKCKYFVKNSRTSCMLMPGTPGAMKMGNNQRNKFWCNNKNRIPITCPRADFLYILLSLSF